MSISEGKSKTYRVLDLYKRLNHGETINIKKDASTYHVSERSIKRDIEDINDYLYSTRKSEDEVSECLEDSEGYKLINISGGIFLDSELFALAKIVLESRAFSKDEMNTIISNLLCLCNNKKEITELIQNEWFNYIPPRHNKKVVDTLWKACLSVKDHKYVNVSYTKQNGETKERKLIPKGIIFSEFYFYLVADICGLDKGYPAVYRIDRFEKYELTDEVYKWEYSSKFQEGKYGKLIHFMYQGELKHLKFKFWGDSTEAVLDRIPTAEIVGHEGNKTLFKADVFDNGIIKWLLSQGEFLEVTEPEFLKSKMKETLSKMLGNYL